ncbi:MAG: hypothetical protein PHH54_04925 [Candidatus Nanoarchaeia archaeon]|nr:hypothetical protein [Candidatus Nanoarchaeia archaeon]MDD5741301.1 hypothetical protein [Candidatus Nanoarchaeia archaeon]
MADLEHLQLLAQLIDSMEVAINRLERAYQDNDSENFEKAKKVIFDFYQRISEITEVN